MNILLTGASGFLGRRILARLERSGHRIVACCRHPEKIYFKAAGSTVLALDFAAMTAAADWLPHLHGIDAVINCVGIIAETPKQRFDALHKDAPIALFRAAAKTGVWKIVQISALGADDNAASAYHLSKKAADDALRRLHLDWYVLQPSLVYGHGARSMPLLQALSALPLHVVVEDGRQALQPVHVDDVAAAVDRCLQPLAPTRVTLALVGPAPIAYRDLLANLRRRLGKAPAMVLSLSRRLAKLLVRIGKLSGEAALSADNIGMLLQGNSAPSEPLVRWLGRPLRSLGGSLFNTPADQAERWHAGLYFLRPTLRLALAALWLWSGIVSIFFYPHELSYRLLADAGVTGFAAPLALYGLALMDIAFGLATLFMPRPRLLLRLQFLAVLLYTLAVGILLPAFWLHPFGPLLKNLPLLAALLISLQLEGEQP